MQQFPTPRGRSARGPNSLAFCVALAAVAFAYLNFDPLAAGTEPHASFASSPGALSVPTPPAPPTPTPLPASEPTEAGTQAESRTAASTAPVDDQVLRGKWALLFVNNMLRQGCESFTKVSDYTATFYKQERIAGMLGEGQTIDLKLRHEPFSVYMKWKSGDRGRQLIYREGQNDGNMLVQPGGIKGRLTGVLSLDPEGTMAMSECRHPVTKAGLVGLARTIVEYQENDLVRGNGFTCELHDEQEFEGRPCYLFQCTYESEKINPEYRKSLIYIDKELSLPVCVKNFTWDVMSPRKI